MFDLDSLPPIGPDSQLETLNEGSRRSVDLPHTGSQSSTINKYFIYIHLHVHAHTCVQSRVFLGGGGKKAIHPHPP